MLFEDLYKIKIKIIGYGLLECALMKRYKK